MPKFLVVEQAGKGCDYSIGCGIRTSIIEAPDLVAAIKQYEKDMTEVYRECDGTLWSNPWEGESAPEDVDIYEIASHKELGLKEFWVRAQSEIDAQKQAEVEEQEKQELKRLQEKYGDG